MAGWYKDPACTQAWNFGVDVVTGDLSLYPKWDKKPMPPTPDPPVPPVGVEDVDGNGVHVYGTSGAIVIEGLA